jgi:hypothetical protein
MIDARPGAHDAAGIARRERLAAAGEQMHLVDVDAHGAVERHAEARHDVVKLRMGGDAGAAAGQLVGVLLEHHRVPAGAAQQQRGEQAADRAADHQSTRLAHDGKFPVEGSRGRLRGKLRSK